MALSQLIAQRISSKLDSGDKTSFKAQLEGANLTSAAE